MTTFSGFFVKHAGGADQTGRVLLWEQMLYQVLRLLGEAHNRVCSDQGQKKFRALEGWWRKKKSKLNGKTCLVPSEEAISEALWREMEIIKEEIVLKVLPQDPGTANIDTLQVCTEPPRRISSSIGKRAKPTDLRFYRLGSEILDLRVEAKVVLRDGDIKRSYLSGEGLQRFSDTRDPYTSQEIGGMVAYVVTDDRALWLGRIEDAMKAASPPIPTFKHSIQATDATLFCTVPCAPSGHRNEVIVLHLVLEFTCEPDARQ